MKQANTALNTAERHQRAPMEGMPHLVWRAVDGGEWTGSARDGPSSPDRPSSHGWGWLEALHPEDRNAAIAAWGEAMDRSGLHPEYRTCHSEAGAYRWFHTRASLVRDDCGRIVEWFGTSTDIHDLRELQERQKVLVAKLQHRTRNLMGLVRSMSDRTSRASADLPDFRDGLATCWTP